MCLLSSAAFAQTAVKPFDLERFTLNPGAHDSLMLSSGASLEGQSMRVSLTGHYEHQSLVYTLMNQRVGAVVGSRVTAHLAFAYGLTGWLEVGLQLPLVVFQRGDDLTAQGIAPVTSTGLGAPSLQAGFTMLRQSNGAPLDLGLVLGLTLPLGSAAGLSRDAGAGFAFTPRLGLGHAFGQAVRLGAEVGAVLRQADVLTRFSPQTTDEVGSMMSLGVVASTLGEHLRAELDARALVPFSKTGLGFEVLGGVRYHLPKLPLELYALGGPGFGSLPGTPAFRVMAGLAVTPDFGEHCVEGSDASSAKCPALDRDGDGVANRDDRCPDVAGVAALRGCADRDDDGDGVLNLADRCPATKGTLPDGCQPAPAPVPAPVVAVVVTDADGDGVPDAQDACPQAAGRVELKGCPDTDADGVADFLDNCPAVKGEPENQGCPVEQKQLVKIESDSLVLKDKVYFATGTSKVLAQSLPMLEQIAAVMKEHPELTVVQINGHTDNQGGRDYNLKLSQARADAVRSYLVAQGVEPRRLQAKGFGPDQPIADNASAAGREQNRRVEFMSAK